MQAIKVHEFGGPEKLKLEAQVPVPVPAKNEVLIKVKAVGINPVETYKRSGVFPVKNELPFTPGTDVAGVVEKVGSEVTGFKVGDRVYSCQTTSGAYAEYATVQDIYVCHLVDRLSFSQGAALGVPYYTAVKALHIRAEAKPGQTLLIHGASGAVGVATVQLGKAMGLRVVGTAGTTEGMNMVKALGADVVVNHKEPGYVDEIKKAVGAPDLIVEVLSNVNWEKDLDLIKPGGKIMVVGARGRCEIGPGALIPKEASVMGVFVWKTTPCQWQEMHSLLSAGQRTGWLDPRISTEYPLGEAEKAHRDIMDNKGAQGKLVLVTSQ